MSTLLELAMLGTADAPPDSVISTGTGADLLIAERAGDPIERRLLLAAGCRAVLTRAAAVPLEAPSAPAPAPSETRPTLPDGIARLLVGLMRGENRDLLPATLERLGPLGYVLSPAAAAAVLRRMQPQSRDGVRPLLGLRAHWLAAHNPSWSWVLEAPASDGDPAALPDLGVARVQWDEGTTAARKRALAVLRSHAPDEANALLFSGWTSESVKGRLALLQVVGASLRGEDGLFLTHLVKTDRSQRVKDAARRLLVRASGSELADRMLLRASRCLELVAAEPKKDGLVARMFGRRKGRKLLPSTLHVTPPASFHDDWAADGISDKTVGGRWGRKTGWLVQVLSLVSPQALAERMGVEPGILVTAIQDDDLGVLAGLSEGALLHQDATVASILWDRWQRQPQEDRVKDQRGSDVQGRLLSGMHEDARAERIITLMDAADSTLWWPPLAVVEGAWPEPVGERWVSLLEQHLRSVAAGGGEGTSAALTWRSSLTSAGARLPSSCLANAARLYEPAFESSPRWSRALPEFKARIATRLRLEEALASLPAPGGGAAS